MPGEERRKMHSPDPPLPIYLIQTTVRTFYSRVDALPLSSFVRGFELTAAASINSFDAPYNCQVSSEVFP